MGGPQEGEPSSSSCSQRHGVTCSAWAAGRNLPEEAWALSFPTFPGWLSPAAPPRLGQCRAQECGADSSRIHRSGSYRLPKEENMARKQSVIHRAAVHNPLCLSSLSLLQLLRTCLVFFHLKRRKEMGLLAVNAQPVSSGYWI